MIEDALICCPACHGTLGKETCQQCGEPVRRLGGQLRFVDVAAESADAIFQIETQNRSSITGRLFAWGKSLISSEYQPHNHLQSFLDSAEGAIVELGSGSRRLRPNVITVDLFPSVNVDVVADITCTPFRDESIDHVILDSVVEHVADPAAVLLEVRRILRPGGRVFINCPFMLPYHGYPSHYQNFTRDGLRHLLTDYQDCEVRPTFGPMTAWVNMTSETFAVLVAGDRGLPYVVAKGVALLPIFWLKFLDVFFVRNQHSHRIAGMLCATAVR